MSSSFSPDCDEIHILKYVPKYPLTSDTAFLILTSPKRKFCRHQYQSSSAPHERSVEHFPSLSAWRSGMRRLT